MKKYVSSRTKTAIALIALSAACTCSCLASSPEIGWFKRNFKKLTFDEVTRVVDSPREICSRVRHHIEYRSDSGDEWASGKETWERGYGDCEDFAAAVSELCDRRKIDTVTYVIYSEDNSQGHVVVVGLWKGGLWFSSNGWFEYAKSAADIKKKVARNMQWKSGTIVAMEWSAFRGIDSPVIPSSLAKETALPIIGMK